MEFTTADTLNFSLDISQQLVPGWLRLAAQQQHEQQQRAMFARRSASAAAGGSGPLSDAIESRALRREIVEREIEAEEEFVVDLTEVSVDVCVYVCVCVCVCVCVFNIC